MTTEELEEYLIEDYEFVKKTFKQFNNGLEAELSYDSICNILLATLPKNEVPNTIEQKRALIMFLLQELKKAILEDVK